MSEVVEQPELELAPESPADASTTEENADAGENPTMTPEELKAHEEKKAKKKAKNKAAKARKKEQAAAAVVEAEAAAKKAAASPAKKKGRDPRVLAALANKKAASDDGPRLKGSAFKNASMGAGSLY
jgi:hypothetical protein